MKSKESVSQDTIALLRLNLTPGLGRATLIKLLRSYAAPADIVRHSREHWGRTAGVVSSRIGDIPSADAALVLKARAYLERNQVELLTGADEGYPAALKNISDPPALLYLQGHISSKPGIAVVGSRRATRDGRRMAYELGRDLAAAGFCVVSGLAQGIDSAAHEGALSVTGTSNTMAVLGGGIDVVYPRKNLELYTKIAARGGLVSEYPPGSEPMAHHFPGRNRIISALSLGVVVVEAAERSGSLITADFALEHGHDVFAVPGSVYSHASAGTLQLLKDGAIMVTCAQDVIDEYTIRPGLGQDMGRNAGAAPVAEVGRTHERIAPDDSSGAGDKDKDRSAHEDLSLDGLSPEEEKVFILLGSDPVYLDEIAGESGLTPMELSSIVLHLELQGLITALPGGRYIRA